VGEAPLLGERALLAVPAEDCGRAGRVVDPRPGPGRRASEGPAGGQGGPSAPGPCHRGLLPRGSRVQGKPPMARRVGRRGAPSARRSRSRGASGRGGSVPLRSGAPGGSTAPTPPAAIGDLLEGDGGEDGVAAGPGGACWRACWRAAGPLGWWAQRTGRTVGPDGVVTGILSLWGLGAESSGGGFQCGETGGDGRGCGSRGGGRFAICSLPLTNVARPDEPE
jgi:hypothetical protein